MSAQSRSTHCPYCALQCAMHVGGSRAEPAIEGDVRFPVNRGALCVKGFTAGKLLAHPDRLTTPLVRNARGVLSAATWDEALAKTITAISETQKKWGHDAVGVFGSGALTNEKAYLLGKFARVALRTSRIDYNGRFCMSSAAAAATKAFGIDRGLPFPVEDIAGADVILLVGGNLAETMPPIMQHLEAQRARGGTLIVIDPRRTLTAQAATLHLRLTPGSDAALANGLLHLLVRDGALDEAYIRARTEGFGAVRAAVASYWPERVERITGVSEQDLERAARHLGGAEKLIVLSGRGAEQQSRGVDNTLAFINLALARGAVGEAHAGFGCVTGQGNGQGGREHGQKADQLPGYRKITDPAARKHVAAVWGVPEDELPGVGLSAYELLDSLGQEGGVRALFVFGSNVVVSSPNAVHVESRLRALDFLLVSDFFLSETAAMADVVLPSAQWAEEAGTMTNLEGRVLLRQKVFDAPEGVRTDLEILCGLAARMGRGGFFPTSEPRDVFDELRRASAGGPADYAGISYERIERESGVFWPCPSEDHPGTPRLFAETFPTPSGRARFHAVFHKPPAEDIDAEYPLYLTTGRILAHYQSGTQTRRVDTLVRMAPSAIVEMHPSVAERHGLADGDGVRLATRRGAASFVVKVTATVREDTLFAPFHWGGDESVNKLTSPVLDETSRMPDFKVCAVRVDRIPRQASTRDRDRRP